MIKALFLFLVMLFGVASFLTGFLSAKQESSFSRWVDEKIEQTSTKLVETDELANSIKDDVTKLAIPNYEEYTDLKGAKTIGLQVMFSNDDEVIRLTSALIEAQGMKVQVTKVSLAEGVASSIVVAGPFESNATVHGKALLESIFALPVLEVRWN